MDEELAKLFQAFENDGDIHACVKIVARNFPAFSTNDIIFTFPDELLVDIMLSEECVFPEPEQIVTFFIKLFEKYGQTMTIYTNKKFLSKFYINGKSIPHRNRPWIQN